MGRNLPLLIFMILFAASASSKGIQLSQADLISIPAPQLHKLGSGYLQLEVSKKIKQQQQPTLHTTEIGGDSISLVIYSNAVLDHEMIEQLQEHGCIADANSWTPPVGNHKIGYFLAKAPAEKVLRIMQCEFIQKMDSAERMFKPQSNVAAQTIEADYYWSRGYTGGDVKIAILDAGLDATNADLPASFEKMDYSNYPLLDENVVTFATGHGTHVAGIALGRGLLSSANNGNGGSPYKGIAPGADLAFLKIGKDSDGTAKGTVIYNTLDAAVQTYNADVINLSYGSWDIYHDGSYYLDQKVDDIVYNYDVPVIVAAGNMAAAGRHYSETVPANSTSDFIQVDVTNAYANSDLLKFNAVWYDGLGIHNEVTLEYYDANYNALTDVRFLSQAESPRGTEHQVSYYNPYIPAGNQTYFLKIVNNSENDQLVHLYEDDENWNVRFHNPNEFYTICSPATADNAFAVGACGSRESWTDFMGGVHTSSSSETLCSFSGRGPRVDGLAKPQVASPGLDIISLRDQNVYTTPSTAWIDDDGSDLGNSDAAHYMVRSGTSMAAPVVAGAAALILDQNPGYSASQVYAALTEYADAYQGVVPPDVSWGFGALDLDEEDGGFTPIGVHLISFSAETHSDSIRLKWRTASEINHAGYNILRSLEHSEHYLQINSKLITNPDTNTLNESEYVYLDSPEKSGSYSYKLEQISLEGERTLFGPVSTIHKTMVNYEGSSFRFSLSKNYPNPFNPSTAINFEIERTTDVEIAVYNLLGCKVKTLIMKKLDAGAFSTSWNGRNEFGEQMSSGAYIIHMNAGDFFAQQKATLLR